MTDSKQHYAKHRNYQLAYATSNKYQIRSRNREYYKKLRKEIVSQLGGKCVKCGFSDSRALQVDHINGGGSIAKKSSTRSYYLLVLRELTEESPKYQLLCANCNWIKRYEKEEIRK